MDIKGLSADRRSSLPILSWAVKSANAIPHTTSNGGHKSRRKSAPDLRALANPDYMRPMSLTDIDHMNSMNNNFMQRQIKTKTSSRNEYHKEVGTRHRGTFDDDYNTKIQDIAHKHQRHTVSGTPTKKKRVNNINENIKNVLKNASNDDNVVIESDKDEDEDDDD
eukprot:291806_1